MAAVDPFSSSGHEPAKKISLASFGAVAAYAYSATSDSVDARINCTALGICLSSQNGVGRDGAHRNHSLQRTEVGLEEAEEPIGADEGDCATDAEDADGDDHPAVDRRSG